MDELTRASIFAMSSRKEGFPMVLLEAMSVGLPVVAYDCPTGPSDIVSEDVDGYVVPDGRTRLMAEALGRLMEDDDRRRRFGEGALEKVKRYDLAAIAGRWEELFGELAAAKRSAPTAPRRAAATARARE
jgi:glycosyltransferase involved in cell wall biosynthesis